MNHDKFPDGEIRADDLTWREQEILMLLAERMTNREIAQRLHLAESTIKDYVGKILSKLFVKNRRQAVERAKSLGLLDEEQKTKVTPAHNLPAESTPFVGRLNDLVEIKKRLLETRLLTLIGPGGIGKTRLALKVAKDMADEFEDGCFFVALAPIRSVDHLAQTIAEALKFPLATQEDPQQQLLRYLRKRQLLLATDNFEHLLEGVNIVSEILRAAPGVKILATSRERLSLQSETVYYVDGMNYPDPDDSSITLDDDAGTLFILRAGKVRPGFEPSPKEYKQIKNICRIVQGTPLAIELAAAWLHILSVEEITQELEKGFDILATEVRDAPERHRSIRAVFEHSWSLLPPSEQKIFLTLAVFRGGFTREAAQQVTSASLIQLRELVNKSFLSHDPDAGRLEVHELLRQYAQERLEENTQTYTAAHEAHAAYYASFIQERWIDIKGRRQLDGLAEIEVDIENLRTAWRHYLDQKNIAQLWKFIQCLQHVYWIRWWNHAGMALFAEAASALEGENDDESLPLRALAMAYQSYFMAWLGLAEEGYEIAEESVAILKKFNHSVALIFAYDSLGVNAYFLYRYTEEVEAINKMVEIAKELNDKWLLAFTLFAAGMAALIEEDYPKARRLAETHLNLCDEIGDVIGSTIPLIVLGHVSLALDELEKAREFYLRCLKIAQETGFYYSIQTASKYLSKVALSLGLIPEAEKYLLQSLRITKDIGFVRDIVNLLYEYARLRVAQEYPEQAVELLALVIQHPASEFYRMMEGRIRDSARRLLIQLEAELHADTFRAALKRGQAMDLDNVTDDLVGLKS